MFSEELRILDRNTTKYMIDELHEQVEAAQQIIVEKDQTINSQVQTIEEQAKTIEQLKMQLHEQGG